MKKSIRLFTTVMVCMAMALCVSCKKDNAEPGGGNTGGGGTGGEISGRFSVSSVTKVEFAPGNLYWDGSAFRFEANQWDYANSWNDKHVSHFKWSDAEHAVTDDYDYNGGLFCASNFTVAGDSHTWRTLNKAEWDYLLNSRTNASSLRAWKKFDGGMHNGLVILPDGTDASVMSSITSTSDLATHNAVFLPAAGYRRGTVVNGVGSYGDYWSSTPNEGYEDRAWLMGFNSDYASTGIDYRGNGHSVRLVR
ncbi:MAG: DUF1566 domain-containing protein [Bacteroidales bacterium]|nr:DUF1566 domain-containing protein [Bacteroidales bacterium]